jgi:putative endonuclease
MACGRVAVEVIGMASTKKVGDLGERIAETFLVLKGYGILRRNYRYAGREIDLLVQKDGELVAVEVKLRRGSRFGRAAESIDRRKLARIRLALEGALADTRSALKPRIDAIVIDLEEGLSEMVVRHIEAVC